MIIVIAGFAFVDDTNIVNAAKLVNTKGEDFFNDNKKE